MIVAAAVDQLETCSQQFQQTVRTMARNWQTAALFRPIKGESSHNQRAADVQRAFQSLDVGRLFSRIGQKMEGCAIVPDIIGLRRLPKSGVAGNPRHLVSLGAETLLRRIERSRREIEHSHIDEPFSKKAVNQP